MAESARVRLIRAAQSDELREVFRQLADMEGPGGPRFPRRILMDLAARIVGRAYEPMLLELCHLARAALLAGGLPAGRRATASGTAGLGFEWLFWGIGGSAHQCVPGRVPTGKRPLSRASFILVRERRTGSGPRPPLRR